jgi:hypothetical protein
MGMEMEMGTGLYQVVERNGAIGGGGAMNADKWRGPAQRIRNSICISYIQYLAFAFAFAFA